jgi:lipopolysaccharide/colanic/teichoic acid biosynthesis glycosyltransferase
MMQTSSLLRAGITFAASVVGFGSAVLIYSLLTGSPAEPPPYTAALLLAVLAFWIVAELRSDTDDASALVVFIELLSFTTGVNLILQALFAYAFDTEVAPMPVLLSGGAVASALILLIDELPPWRAARRRTFLLLGYDRDAAEVAHLTGRPVIGVFDDERFQLPESLPALGRLDRATVKEISRFAAHVIVGPRNWCEKIPVDLLLQLRLAGIPVEDAAHLYERTLRRVRYTELGAQDLFFSPALKTGRHIMAIQAVYTDLMCLLLLILLSPLLLITGVAVIVFGGSGPVLERIECLGFQGIPFQLLRFRTRNSRTGAQTYIGELIARLHLVNLPQLLNILRGEMVFFGPRPVRKEFAERLGQVLPYYSHRFSVKPGVAGWAQVNVPRLTVPPEPLRMEYDFYYIRQGSLALDLEILIRSILGGTRQPEMDEVKP